MSDLVGNPEDRISHNEAHISTSDHLFSSLKTFQWEFDVPVIHDNCALNELRREKTFHRGFRPGPTQTGLYRNIFMVRSLTIRIKL